MLQSYRVPSNAKTRGCPVWWLKRTQEHTWTDKGCRDLDKVPSVTKLSLTKNFFEMSVFTKIVNLMRNLLKMSFFPEILRMQSPSIITKKEYQGSIVGITSSGAGAMSAILSIFPKPTSGTQVSSAGRHFIWGNSHLLLKWRV